MQENEGLAILLGIILGILITGVILSALHATYKDGQIDALEGRIYYHQVEQTPEWKSCMGLCQEEK